MFIEWSVLPHLTGESRQMTPALHTGQGMSSVGCVRVSGWGKDGGSLFNQI